MMRNALILCSGGLDSVIVANLIEDYDNKLVIFFDYCQNSLEKEKEFSRKCAEKTGADFKEIKLNLDENLKVLPLTSHKKVEHGKDLKDTSEESSQWYVPMRNLIFLSNVLALAETDFINNKSETDIFVGFKNEGRENYPDTTKEFVDAVNNVAKATSEGKIKVLAPLLEMDKEDVVSLGKKLGVNFKETYSCYIGKEKHCGKCLACRLRHAGFYWADEEDPTDYEEKPSIS